MTEEECLESPLFFASLGFHTTPLPHTALRLRRAAAGEETAGGETGLKVEVESRASLLAYSAGEDRLWDILQCARRDAVRRGLSGAEARRQCAEAWVKGWLHLGGPLAVRAHQADLHSLRAKWPRACAAAAAKGLPELHLLNIKSGISSGILDAEEALNWHLVAFDVLGDLDDVRSEGVPPHPAKRGSSEGAPPGCVVA